MKKISEPIIYEFTGTDKSLHQFQIAMKQEAEEHRKLILEYPTVYLYNHKGSLQYEVYVGETGDIVQRTKSHLRESRTGSNRWQRHLKKKKMKVYVIGHHHFNKSLTLDIENRLMLYLSSSDRVKAIYNGRGNEQNDYYTSDEMDSIFNQLWEKLRSLNCELFPVEQEVKDSALFKASPFHKLTEEQYFAKKNIFNKIDTALLRKERGQLIFISGEAGSGKTVLMSNLFYDLCTNVEAENGKIKSYLLVNHEEQLTVYKQIAKKLGLLKEDKDIVSRPTRFINNHVPEEPVDVILVDEAHLLWTQGKQSYRGSNQLKDLIARARVTVVMFDKHQILNTEQYWEDEAIEKMEQEAKKKDNYIELKNQLRIDADDQTVKWIRNVIDHQEIARIPEDSRGYEITIFDSPRQLHEEIKNKAEDEASGLSRIVATFDWEYKDKQKPRLQKYWEVMINSWSLPWNKQTKPKQSDQKKQSGEAWAQQTHTIDEVGSTFTIQGFDLNYAGVILGPSVKYRNGRIIFDKSASKNGKVTRNRTVSDGSKKNFAEMFIKNEMNVLLTRGVHGLYIYAVDEELREALKKAQK